MPPSRVSQTAKAKATATSTARRAPRRRRDAADTRERLLAAGRKAFAQKGLAGAILTDDILAPAGVSTGSFYHQFRDKNALLLAILDDHAESFRETLVRTLGAPDQTRGARFVDVARACYALALDLADENGDLLRIERRERDSEDREVARYLKANQERWISQVGSYFAQGSDEDVSDADCRLAAQFVIDLGLTAVARYQELPARRRPAERDRLLDALVRFTVGGLPGLTRERNENQESRS